MLTKQFTYFQCPEFFSSPENEERFKEFRTRLQYFARGCQTYHSQLQAALKGKDALELKEEQVRIIIITNVTVIDRSVCL